jgi:hypothetical protein
MATVQGLLSLSIHSVEQVSLLVSGGETSAAASVAPTMLSALTSVLLAASLEASASCTS